jgi:hypothetical protein
LNRHQLIHDVEDSDDFLICLVNTDDVLHDSTPMNVTDDHNTCICPDSIRPYKAKNDVWSLQKAIQFTFSQALDKSLTLSIWSCGLDTHLQTWLTNQDKQTRQSLISYAINDLFAPTHLYFHLTKNNLVNQPSPSSSNLNSVMNNPTIQAPLFLILSDSHGRYLPSTFATPNHHFVTRSISGLQWIKTYDDKLCARSILLTPSITSILARSAGILCIIGTNSVRATHASQIITQVENVINVIRTHHAHLIHKHDITIVATFPCFNLSKRFPSITLLQGGNIILLYFKVRYIEAY